MPKSLGLQITDVRIRRTDLTQEVSQQTFDRMKAERLAEAERLRARGREAAQRIKAIADRQVVEIIAEARKESEIARGQGEGERSLHLRRSVLERSGLLRVLPVDDGLWHGVGQHGNNDGAVAEFRVLPLFPGLRAVRCRRSAVRRHGSGRLQHPPLNRGRCTAMVDFSWDAVGLFLVFEGLLYGCFPLIAKRVGARCQRTAGRVPAHCGRRFRSLIGVAVVWLARG